MTSSAVLGAATGTGLALLVAMTIVVYRYYASRRWGKEWNYKGSWTAGPATYYYRTNKPAGQQAYVTTQKVTSELPPMVVQAGCLQRQDRSAVTYTSTSSSHARRCLIWLSCVNRFTCYTTPLANI
ncbi:hypothetical protein J6590_058968 [Homalodisca vitripennis]|nr:hypothetical protein J6590_058968 [Homalodisca vitripennis]